MLTIDGSTLEGGGQLTRMALCLAAITRTPIRVHSIRAGRGSQSASARIAGYHISPSAIRIDPSTAVDRTKGNDRRGHDRDRDRGYKSAGRGKPSLNQKDRRTVKPAEGGLKESHVAALRWLAEQVDARVEGDELGSREVLFRPRKKLFIAPDLGHDHDAILAQARDLYRRKDSNGDDGDNPNIRNEGDGHDADENSDNDAHIVRQTITLQRPGSVWLIFQAIFPFMVFEALSPLSKVRDNTNAVQTGRRNQNHTRSVLRYDITLHGGTNVPKAMSTEYVQQVFLPMSRLIGLPEVKVDLIKRGWTTGVNEIGEVRVRVYAATVPPLSLPPSEQMQGRETTSKSNHPQQDGSIIEGKEEQIKAGFDEKAGKQSDRSSPHEQTPTPTPTPTLMTTRPFVLPPFHLHAITQITHINITILCPPSQHVALWSLLVDNITAHPVFQALPQEPSIALHPSSSSPPLPPNSTPSHDTRHASTAATTAQTRRSNASVKITGNSRTSNTNSGDSNMRDIDAEEKEFAHRLYILLTATSSSGIVLGRDILGTGARFKTVQEKEKALSESARRVVHDLMKEVESKICYSETDKKVNGEAEIGVDTVDDTQQAPRVTGVRKARVMVDEYLEDQLVIFQALADGASSLGSRPVPTSSGTNINFNINTDDSDDPRPSIDNRQSSNQHHHHQHHQHQDQNQVDEQKEHNPRTIPLPLPIHHQRTKDPNKSDRKVNEEASAPTRKNIQHHQKEDQPSLHTQTMRWLCHHILAATPSSSSSSSSSSTPPTLDPDGTCTGIGWNTRPCLERFMS